MNQQRLLFQNLTATLVDESTALFQKRDGPCPYLARGHVMLGVQPASVLACIKSEPLVERLFTEATLSVLELMVNKAVAHHVAKGAGTLDVDLKYDAAGEAFHVVIRGSF